jgi:tRNA threonylcarbamoyl adenosine modification protein (Sua5/YciO/YrdC/YwlC family)/tRNA threonylcarbamoyl adenosine modification protein YjeE
MKTIKIEPATWQTTLEEAVAVLQSGGLIIFPTETTYGLGADATNPEAVAKLLAYKTKRSDKPLSIAVCDEAMADEYVVRNDTAKSVYRRFLPGPVTVVSHGKQKVAPGVESPTKTLGVRIPDYPALLELIRAFGKPITATSANASGEKRPYTLDDIWKNTSQKQQDLIALALDAGELPHNEPSTVIDTTQESLNIVRAGNLKPEKKENWTSKSEQETRHLGANIARRYRSHYGYHPVIFALIGEMGAGKTQFTKGLAQGLQIDALITSPTYTLLHEFSFKNEGQTVPFIHMDAWRVENEAEFSQLGLEPYLNKNAVVSVEWPKSGVQLSEYPNAKIIWLELKYGASESERLITLQESA